MPDEFKLRPYSLSGLRNDAHEQGARALAAAIIKEAEAEVSGIASVVPTDAAYKAGVEVVLSIIERLVPPLPRIP